MTKFIINFIVPKKNRIFLDKIPKFYCFLMIFIDIFTKIVFIVDVDFMLLSFRPKHLYIIKIAYQKHISFVYISDTLLIFRY